jgi:glycosyltransferase involved in cell wall biosynthesis
MLGQPTPSRKAFLRETKGAWLLVPEVVYNRKDHIAMRKAVMRGVRLAAIVHDAIPISHPELVRREAAQHHATYMTVLAGADLLIAVSNTAAHQFSDFARSRSLTLPPIRVCHSPGEILSYPRQPPRTRPLNGPVRILCVSTLDPRKNHQGLIRAFNLACSSIPDADLFLDLVGAPYKDAESLVQEVKQAVVSNPRISWHGSVSPEKLLDLYSRCDFTVYPSIVEGFGLPILESLWAGRPCICANFGAMAETATGGGCLMIDVRDPEQLREAVVALATQPKLSDRLTSELEHRSFKSWSDYASEICEALSGFDALRE